MHCPHCGTQIEDGFEYCPLCGKRVAAPDQADRKQELLTAVGIIAASILVGLGVFLAASGLFRRKDSGGGRSAAVRESRREAVASAQVTAALSQPAAADASPEQTPIPTLPLTQEPEATPPLTEAPAETTVLATEAPTPVPTAVPTPVPTAAPTPVPTAVPTPVPTAAPTPVPTAAPTPVPTIPLPWCVAYAPVTDFYWPDSSSRRYSKSEYNSIFAGNSREMYYKSQIFIDEIYARYGYTFSETSHEPGKDTYEKYKDMDWYRTAQENCPSQSMDTLLFDIMSETERYNILLVNEWQQDYGVEAYD